MKWLTTLTLWVFITGLTCTPSSISPNTVSVETSSNDIFLTNAMYNIGTSDNPTDKIQHFRNYASTTSRSTTFKKYLTAGSLTTNHKSKIDNTKPLQNIFNQTYDVRVGFYQKFLVHLNVTNTTVCENGTEAVNAVTYSTTPKTLVNSSSPSPTNSTVSPSYEYPPLSASTPVPCNLTTIFHITNVNYSFDPVHTDGLSFIRVDENSPFITVLRYLDRPEKLQNEKNATHNSLCQQFSSSHLSDERHFNFNSSFNNTHSIVSLDRCETDTFVIIFDDHQTWYKYPQGIFLSALEKVLKYYGFHNYLLQFIGLLDDHKCKFDVRSTVQHSQNGDYFNKHYRNRHLTSWGVCNNFYQHVNLTQRISYFEKQ
ncbi:protein EE5 [Elephantid betaherpesvirus 1]|uniref:Protein EE5 n=3 Tax=Elephantid herpesvirus 1 TaxID=146015 RepID=M4JV07_ELHV1|nr:protein EE5 [Elephantid betaherpesvirus 1]AID07190.1 ser/thr-rich glycoprotein ORF-O [Elephant endotheliotropic herpesvirus 1A/1B]AID07308.1 ser/thr-rich glycoprotein ORF-O [Elephant endotheliotropic herpesvirus 1B]